MDVKFSCAKCGQSLVIDEEGAGLRVPCPTCSAGLTVPGTDAACARGAQTNISADEMVTPYGVVVRKLIAMNKNWMPDCPRNIHDQIQRSLSEGDARGETMRELARRVQNEFSGVDEDRAYRIAHTEMLAAYGRWHFKGLKLEGCKTKRWITGVDELARPSHVKCGEQGAILIDEPFSNGLMYPGDLSAGKPDECAGCQCYLESGDPAGET